MSPSIDRRFVTPDPVRLAVRILAGDIHVSSTDAPESTVTVEGSRELLDQMKVELVGGRLIVELRRRSFIGLFGRFDDSLQVTVAVPDHSRVAIATASADATLDGRFGGLETRSASGDVRVDGELHGDVVAKTASGAVRLRHVHGDFDVQTVSGDAVADSVAGALSVRSVSGDVRIASLHEGRANVQSVSGDVALGIAPGTNIDVDAASASGELRSDFPLSDAPGPEGGPSVVIRGRTVSGDFRLFRAA